MKKNRRVKAKSTRKVKSTKRLSLFIVIPLILVSLFVVAATIYQVVEIIFTNSPSSNLPRLEISLTEVPIEQIDTNSKEIKYPNNTATLTINGESTTYENVEIKGRGNFSWSQPKKPYQIKLKTKESLFGLSKNKKWVLLANYFDPAYLRTDLAYHLKTLLETAHPLNGQFVELYMDDSYRGLYFFSEKIEAKEGRISLQNPYGIIMELDNLRGVKEDCNYTKNNECFVLHDSVESNNEKTAINNFIETYNELISAIKQKRYHKISTIIDVDSFAKYYLLSEFTANPDAYSTSFFMYKDGLEDKIHAGPGWDFDFALGNKNWSAEWIDKNTFYSPFETMTLKNYLNISGKTIDIASISTLLYDLMDIPEFEQRVKEIYQSTLSGKGEELLEYIKKQAEYIRPAALRDQDRWKLKTNFDEEVDYLIDWVAKRYDHFEETYGANSDQAPESPQPSPE